MPTPAPLPRYHQPRRRAGTAAAVLALAGALLGAAPAQALAQTAPRTGAPTGTTAPAASALADTPSAAIISAESAASARAKATKKPVTVDAETDTGTLVTANPDGTFTSTVSSEPVRVKQNGAWVPIDPTLAFAADGTVRAKATATGIAFSAGGTAPMATMAQGSDKLSFSWPTALPKPTLSGGDATYPNVLPGVNLVLTANASGFSELLVVENAQAAANPALKTLTFGVQSTGVKVAGTADGGADAVDPNGATVFHTDTATMWDSSGSPTAAASTVPNAQTPSGTKNAAPTGAKIPQSQAAAPSVTPSATQSATSAAAPLVTAATHLAAVGVKVTGTTETLTPNLSLLTSPSTKYPVAIDPAWTGDPSQMDWARISSNGYNIYNSTSTGSDDHPREGYDGWAAGETARTYYQLTLGSSTGTKGVVGAKITAATLSVKNYWAASDGSTPVDAFSVGTPPKSWNSTGLTWSNKPSWTELSSADSNENCGTTTCTSVTPGTLQFSVLNAVKTAATGTGTKSVTLGLGAPSETDEDEWKQFASGGGASLSITYYRNPDLVGGTGSPVTTPSTAQSGVTYVTSHTPTMKITSEDTDGENVRNGYEIWHWAGGAATTSVQTGMFSAYSANGGAYTYTGSLADGTYAWRGSSESVTGLLWSPWSKWNVFTVDTTVPVPPNIESPQFPAGQYGGAYGDAGTFNLTTNGTSTVKGYLFSLDATLGTTVFGGSSVVTWTAGTQPVAGKPYWVPASAVPNGYGAVTFPPGTVGPHRIYAKAVDEANNTSDETTYLFYAGLTTPTYVYGDQLVHGYTAPNGTAVPAAAPTVHNGAEVYNQANCCNIQFADPNGLGQAILANGTSPSAVVVGDSVAYSFDIPTAGYWDIGANLTEAKDYGDYSLTLDQGESGAATLIGGFDAYNSPNVTTAYRDFGTPKNPSGGATQLAAGVHTLTLTVTGKDAASAGYQAGIDVLRLAPMSATCEINNLTACLNNTAISPDSDAAAADADGQGASLSATQLAAAGWSATGTSLTVNGAPMTVPGYQTGVADDIVASGQLIQVPANSSSFANDGDAVVFLGFGTNGDVDGATGVITYDSPCSGLNTQSYTLDTVPDWVNGSAGAHVIQMAGRNHAGASPDDFKPQIFAVSVPLACPGQAISSISLPVVSNGVVNGVRELHIMGVGIRAASYTDATDTQNWTGSYADRQDTDLGTWSNLTFRQAAALSVGGTGARVHLSNALGKVPVTLTDVTLGRQDPSGGATEAAAPVRLTFGGATSVTLPAGGEITSDPVSITLAQQSIVLVSETISGQVTDVPGHANIQGGAWYTDGDSVDHAQDTAAGAFSATMTSDPYLTGIDVTSAGNTAGSLVLYGDQTVNADTAAGDGVSHLSDDITDAMLADPDNDGAVPYGVLNLGHNSWSSTNNLLPPVTSAPVPLNAIDPIDREVLDQANVRTVLISTGTSDILANTSAATIEAELVTLSHQIRAYTSDTYASNPGGFVSVYVATIPPATSSAPFTAAQETVRETVNNYILCGVSTPTAGLCSGDTGNNALGGNDDGAIDFAAAVSTDGSDTGSTIAPALLWEDANGKYWPNDTYYQDLAAQYLSDSGPTGTVGVAPMEVGPGN